MPIDIVELDEEAASRSALEWKDEGNALFKQKRFEEATGCYDSALQMLKARAEDSNTSLEATILCNRSAAKFHLKEYAESLEDAESAIAISAQWTKAFHRKGAAQLRMGRLRAAVATYKKATLIDPESKTLAKQLRVAREKLKKSKKMQELYPDRPTIASTEAEQRAIDAKRVFEKIKGCLGDSGAAPPIEGLFTRMLNPEEFRKVMYPGVDVTQLEGMPASFQDMLRDEAFEAELLAVCPKATARATSVLENVKKKGEANGDIMPLETEQALWPGILSEAFARELVTMLKAWNRRHQADMSKRDEGIASAEDERASWDQLFGLDAELAPLRDPAVQRAVVDDYIGEEWAPLILKDAERYWASQSSSFTSVTADAINRRPNRPADSKDAGSSSSVASGGDIQMSWLNDQRLKESYPALWEVAEHLYALPYELNMRHGFALQEPIPNSIMFAVCEKGASFDPRADGAHDHLDNGNMLSVVYHLNGGTSPLCAYVVAPSSGSVPSVIEALPDRLLMYWSRNVATSLPSVEGDKRMTLSIFLKGKSSIDAELAGREA